MLKIKKYILLLLTFAFMFGADVRTSSAVGAYPGVVELTQPDGIKFKARIFGDEYFNYYTTQNGYTISKGADGYYYYVTHTSSGVVFSTAKVTSSDYNAIGRSKEVRSDILMANRALAINEATKYRRGKTRGGSSINTPAKGLVILVEYQDIKYVTPNPKQAFHNLMNQPGYNVGGGKGSVADYYYENSNNTYRPSFDVYGPYTLSRNQKDYGSKSTLNQANYEHTKEACLAAEADGVDFSQYDGDNDGYVDMVLIFYAGLNAAEGDLEAVWPHRGWMPLLEGLPWSMKLDGKYIYDYACSSELRGFSGSEMSGIGTMAHEFGHVIGFDDIYDTDGGSNGASMALWGTLSEWDGGTYNYFGRVPSYMTSFERVQAGWLTPTKIEQSGTYRLKPIQKNECYIIETDQEGEVFYLENRQSTGWDEYLNWNSATYQTVGTKPKGLMITHYDRSPNNMISDLFPSPYAFENNLVNAFSIHQCVDLVEAVGVENWSLPVSYALFPGTAKVTEITSFTSPNLKPWSGKDLGISIKNIRLDGEDVVFDVVMTKVDETKSLLNGKVVDFRGTTIASVPVNFYTSEPTKAVGTYRNIFSSYAPGITRASEPVYTTTTDKNGNFVVYNMTPGKYYVTIDSEKYELLSTNITVTAGVNQVTHVLIPHENDLGWYTMRWHNNKQTESFGVDQDVYVAVKFTKEDLDRYDKDLLSSVSVRNMSSGEVDALIYFDGKVVYHAKKTGATPGGDLVFDLSKEKLSKANVNEVIVAFKYYTDILNLIEMAGLDASSYTPGKGDLHSYDGTNWVSIAKTFGYKANLMISLNLTQNVSVGFPALKVKSSYSAGDVFLPELVNAVENGITGINFEINGTPVTSNTYKFDTAGTYEVVAKYVKANGKKEKLTRKITVK